MARLIRWLAFIAIGAAIAVLAYRQYRVWLRDHPQDVPWTALSLDDPIGRFTLGKIVGLGENSAQCHDLLRDSGVRFRSAPPRLISGDCGYRDGIEFQPRADDVALIPADVVTSCPVAAALVVFEDQVLQRAAMRHLGSRVVAVDHVGSFNCRRMYGRADAPFSEHATADAIDITGFRLADGQRVSVLRDWTAPSDKSRFLKEVRDGACRVFATVLSPDYNRAHADHLHLDQAARGMSSVGYCR